MNVNVFTEHFHEAYEGGRTDMVGWIRESGHRVYASHCVRCGRWARVVAGDDGANTKPNPWKITDCKRCGLSAYDILLTIRPSGYSLWWPKEIPVPRRVKAAYPGEEASATCNSNGGRGIGAGHVCRCVRIKGHPIDSARPHGCSCMALWSDPDDKK